VSDPRHVLLTDSALAVIARAAAPVRLGMQLRDQGDLAVVDGAPGNDVLVVADEPAADWVLDEPGPLAVCWAEGDEVRAHRVAGLGEPIGDRIGTTTVPAAAEAFERVQGIFETDVLRSKSVAVLGLGSGGSFIVRELAKAGVGRFLLLDHDRLEVGNVSRHECGLADVGRLKINAMRDVVHQHHPAAQVHTSGVRLSGETRLQVQDLIRQVGADLVICATDTRESRLLANRICLEEGLPLILGGVYRRAYGGIVQRVVPGLTACYQCFVQALPEQAADNEISSAEDAARASYTDREVAPQPGLSTDIVPIALHMAKLALLELLDGQSPAFAALGADLVAPLHQWINRRELAHAGLEPMGVSIDRLSVLRWYGVLLEQLEDCRVCAGGVEAVKPEDDNFFGGPEPS
jgi:molybdopterin/thiamine biosynthesis adenylyltransferase